MNKNRLVIGRMVSGMGTSILARKLLYKLSRKKNKDFIIDPKVSYSVEKKNKRYASAERWSKILGYPIPKSLQYNRLLISKEIFLRHVKSERNKEILSQELQKLLDQVHMLLNGLNVYNPTYETAFDVADNPVISSIAQVLGLNPCWFANPLNNGVNFDIKKIKTSYTELENIIEKLRETVHQT